jgi:hypothetical protein
VNDIDKISSNAQPLPDKASANQTDIDYLKSKVNEIVPQVAEINKILSRRSLQINGHTSEMPDYKGLNADHDARYATKRALKANAHAAVTVADTPTIDMALAGQQVSAETIGLTDTITITA